MLGVLKKLKMVCGLGNFQNKPNRNTYLYHKLSICLCLCHYPLFAYPLSLKKEKRHKESFSEKKKFWENDYVLFFILVGEARCLHHIESYILNLWISCIILHVKIALKPLLSIVVIIIIIAVYLLPSAKLLHHLEKSY